MFSLGLTGLNWFRQ